MSQRVSYLDVFKGFGIFFVVFGHITHNGILREYIWNFHMPLFFFVSGLLYKPNLSFKEFFLKKTKSLYIPYVLLFCITFLYWVFIERHVRGGEYSIIHQLVGLPYGTYEGYHLNFNGALWFLPCLFITEILFFPISKISNKIGIISFLLLSYSIGTILRINEIDYLPFGLHTAFFALLFYGIGFLSKHLPEILIKTSGKYQNLLLLSCFAIQILSIGHYSSNISECSLAYFPIAFIGIILYLMLSIKITRNIFIEYLGKNSLIILAFQEPVYRAIIFLFSRILNLEVEVIRNNLVLCIILTFVSIAVIVPAIYIYNKQIRQRINTLF